MSRNARTGYLQADCMTSPALRSVLLPHLAGLWLHVQQVLMLLADETHVCTVPSLQSLRDKRLVFIVWF